MKKRATAAAMLAAIGLSLVGCMGVTASDRALIRSNAAISAEAARRWGNDLTNPARGEYIRADAEAWEALNRGVNGGGS